MDPRPGEQLFFHGHPSWRSMLGFYLKGLIGAVGIGAVAGIISAIAGGRVQTGWVIAGVAVTLVCVLLTGTLRRIRTTYTITDQRLTIDRGLLSRDVQETRLERVQNVNSRQSLLERLLRVGTVEFDTAAGAEYDFAFHGVTRPHQIVQTVDRAIQALGRSPDLSSSGS